MSGKSSNFIHNVKINSMKSLLIAAISAVVILSSCSTVYRSGQTPDDVYYSPVPEDEGASYVAARSSRDNYGRRYADRETYSGYDDFATSEDRWLMMRVRNRYRWSLFDDYNYYSPFSPFSSFGMGYYPSMGMGFNSGFYNPYSFSYYNHFNNYWDWNNYYNPYAGSIIIVNPKTNPSGYTKTRPFNLNNYSNSSINNRRPVTLRPDNNNSTRPRYNNTNSNLGNSIRRVFSNSSTESGNNNYSTPRTQQERPSRTYQPTPSNDNNNRNSNNNSGSSGSGSSNSSGSNNGSRPDRR